MGKGVKHDRSGSTIRGGCRYPFYESESPKEISLIQEKRLAWWKKLWTGISIWFEKLFLKRR